MKMSPWAFGYHAERLGFKPKENLVGLNGIYRKFKGEIDTVRANVLRICEQDPQIFSRDPHSSCIVLAELVGGAIFRCSVNDDGTMDEEHCDMMLDMTKEVILNTMLAMHAKLMEKENEVRS